MRDLAETGRLPVIQPGDWDAELLERLKAARFPDDAAIRPIRYEAHQPPLYYLLAAPIYGATSSLGLPMQVLALRSLSIALGGVVVLATFFAGRSLVPGRASIALLGAATAAFVPMFTAISAAINNDSLANALAAVLLAVLLRGSRAGFGDRGALLVGLLAGALILTKVTAYVFVPLALLVLAGAQSGRVRRAPHRAAGPIVRRVILAGVCAVAVSSWWLMRNVIVYGWSDPLGLARHDEIVVGQPRWAAIDLAAAEYFVRVLFRSFWGQFGWMGVVLPDWVYLTYLGLTLSAAAGLMSLARCRAGRSDRPAMGAGDAVAPRTDDVPTTHNRSVLGTCAPGRAQFALLCGAVFLVFSEVVVYNLTFIQPQGRYLFPALTPIALLLTLGWVRLADRWAPIRALVPIGLGVGLAGLNLLCLVRFVGPAFR